MSKRFFVSVVLVLSLVASVHAADYVVIPTGLQDGAIYGNLAGYNAVEVTITQSWYGVYNGTQLATVVILTLPEGVTSDMIASATLEVPQMDYVWPYHQHDEGYPYGFDYYLNHIDATNDNIVRLSDMDPERDLGVIGVFRSAGPAVVDYSRMMTYDVTDLVKDDLDNERASFAFKTVTIIPEGFPTNSADSFAYPTVENTEWTNRDTTLSITYTPEPATIALLLFGGLGILRRKKV